MTTQEALYLVFTDCDKVNEFINDVSDYIIDEIDNMMCDGCDDMSDIDFYEFIDNYGYPDNVILQEYFNDFVNKYKGI